MGEEPFKKLRVYFDGACHLCSREIAHICQRYAEAPVTYVDIADPDFSAASEGLDDVAVQRYLHVRLPSGEVRTGVDAFLVLWEATGQFPVLKKIIAHPFVKPGVKLAYHIFAVGIRPYLPKRRRTSLGG